MVLGYCISVVLTNNYCIAPGCSLIPISGSNLNRFTKKTPCILNIVASYLSMKVVTTGRFCRASTSNISACVVFLFYCI